MGGYLQVAILIFGVHEGVLHGGFFPVCIGEVVHTASNGCIIEENDPLVVESDVRSGLQRKASILRVLVILAHEVGQGTIESVAERHIAGFGRFEDHTGGVIGIDRVDVIFGGFLGLFPGILGTNVHDAGTPHFLGFKDIFFFDGFHRPHCEAAGQHGEDPACKVCHGVGRGWPYRQQAGIVAALSSLCTLNTVRCG